MQRKRVKGKKKTERGSNSRSQLQDLSHLRHSHYGNLASFVILFASLGFYFVNLGVLGG